MDAIRSNHSVYNINYHFVWTPKYRHEILGEVEDKLEKWIEEIGEDNDYSIVLLHIAEDHIHLFLSAHPKHAPSDIIRRIKSITARKLWDEYESMIEQYF